MKCKIHLDKNSISNQHDSPKSLVHQNEQSNPTLTNHSKKQFQHFSRFTSSNCQNHFKDLLFSNSFNSDQVNYFKLNLSVANQLKKDYQNIYNQQQSIRNNQKSQLPSVNHSHPKNKVQDNIHPITSNSAIVYNFTNDLKKYHPKKSPKKICLH